VRKREKERERKTARKKESIKKRGKGVIKMIR
jgi:hypothetical protein